MNELESLRIIDRYTQFAPIKDNAKHAAQILKKLYERRDEETLNKAIKIITTKQQWAVYVYYACVSNPELQTRILESINSKPKRKARRGRPSKIKGMGNHKVINMFVKVAKEFSNNPNTNPPPNMKNLERHLNVWRGALLARKILHTIEESIKPYLIKWILNTDMKGLREHISTGAFYRQDKDITEAIGIALEKKIINILEQGAFEGMEFVNYVKEYGEGVWYVIYKDKSDNTEEESSIILDEDLLIKRLGLSRPTVKKYVPDLKTFVQTSVEDLKTEMQEMKKDYKSFSTGVKRNRSESGKKTKKRKNWI